MTDARRGTATTSKSLSDKHLHHTAANALSWGGTQTPRREIVAHTDTLPEAFPRGFILSITDAAAERVATVIDQHELPATAGLRVGVVEGGCSGLNYDVGIADAPRDEETVFELNGTRVFVSPFSAQHVNGMRVDWVSTMMESRFVFENPNATGGCGCGISFTTQ